MKTAAYVATISLALVVSAPAARAHAFLDHASPLVGATVSAPHEVRMWFTQALEPQFSSARVHSSAGSVVGTGHVDAADPKQLVVPVRPLPPGRYKVDWQVLSVDTHRTQGSFTFEVKP